MSDTITDQLIGFRSVDVPADAAQMMRLSLFDWAACGIAGAQEAVFTEFKALHLAQIHCSTGDVVGAFSP